MKRAVVRWLYAAVFAGLILGAVRNAPAAQDDLVCPNPAHGLERLVPI